MINEKIYPTADDLLLDVEDWKQHGYTIVFTNGCFDILHPGHIDYLEKASKLGDKLIVALNSDASVSKLKGKHRPLQSQEARTKIMAALSMVDAVVIFGEDTPLEIITLLKPDVLVKGGDYKIEEIVGSDLVRENGGKVFSLDFLEGYSTSAIEKKIKES